MFPAKFYTHVRVDIPHDLMKHVIGTNGRWFKLTSDKCMVDYIWFNKQRSIVEIWGPLHNLMAAHYAILSRINFIKERFIVEHNETCDDNKITWPNDSYMEVDLNNPDHLLDVINVKFLIGRQGIHFKHITKQSGVSFIWYNVTNHCIQIWGLQSDIPKAIGLIKERISQINSSL